MYIVLVPEPNAVNAERLLALLWREKRETSPVRRGPRPALSVDEVIATAVAIADETGIAGLTMREVAKRLRVAPMSVYTYVPGKTELLLLMLDAVHRDMHRSKPSSDDWRARVRAIADDNRKLHVEHPWIVELPPNRPALGPGTLGKYEHELAALDRTCLSDVEIDACLTWLLGFVESCAHAAARARAAVDTSAQSDSEWWDVHGPLLTRVLDPAAYPLGTRIGSASAEALGGTYQAEHAYQFGLARVLDGLAGLIERA